LEREVRKMNTERVENPVKIRDAKKLSAPQCPECGYWNVKVARKRRVDFYGVPVVWKCECGWQKEITEEDFK